MGNPHAGFDEAGTGNGPIGHRASSRPYLGGAGVQRISRDRGTGHVVVACDKAFNESPIYVQTGSGDHFEALGLLEKFETNHKFKSLMIKTDFIGCWASQ